MNEAFSVVRHEFAKRKNILTSDLGGKLSMEGKNAVSFIILWKRGKRENGERDAGTDNRRREADNTSTNCDWPEKS